MKKLSVVLATRNEEENIASVLASVSEIADEIVVVDEDSSDNTREIAKNKGARVYKVKHEPIFHKTKQKALDKASGEWILQLDADERVTKKLANEIKRVINMNDEDIKARRPKDRKKWELFQRHLQAFERKKGKMGKSTGEVVAFLLPRLNYFLGKPLRRAGVYPDPAVRLIKKGRAFFPAKSVHENMHIEGEVAWLFNDLKHYDSPTYSRYLMRLNRYTSLQAEELRRSEVPKNIIQIFNYSFIQPVLIFVNLYFRHAGFRDGLRGFVWSLSSAFHFPIAYYKYWGHENSR